VHLLLWIILFCLLGGILSVIAASSILLVKEKHRTRLVPHLVSFAVGALLGAAFLVILPHAVSVGGSAGLEMHDLTLTVLIGLLAFFLLEKLVLWRHCHSHHCVAHHPNPVDNLKEGQRRSKIALILIGDGIHNFVDGFAIAAAFMVDFHLGVVTSIALAAHEIPQEVGDFAILLDSGLSRKKALIYNGLASLTTVVGGVIAYFGFAQFQGLVPYVLAIAAASFIYIAVADLIPGLHERSKIKETLMQFLLIICGILVIYFTHDSMHI